MRASVLQFWTPVIFLAVVMSGLISFMAGLFPWAILAAMIAYVSVGVGTATLRRVDRKYLSAVLLGFVLPAGAVVSAAVNSALPALQISTASASVQAALNRSIYWSSVQGLGNGFLFLVLVIAAMVTEAIDRNFGRAAIWCLIAAAFLMDRPDALGHFAMESGADVRRGMAGGGSDCLLCPMVGRTCSAGKHSKRRLMEKRAAQSRVKLSISDPVAHEAR